MSSVRLGSNIASLTAQRRLSESTASLGRIYERLSSGQRINQASDDAAGLSVVSSLDTKRRVFTQGIRNLNDGISLLNIADGAAEQLSSIVIRLKELAEQAANGTYGVKQRKALDAEAQALSKEYFRIARSTTFNGRGVFFSEFGELRLQGGYGADGGIQSGLGGAIGSGTFGSATTYQTPQSCYTTTLGDINGDGILDLAASGDSGIATIMLGTGGGAFSAVATYQMEATGPSRASWEIMLKDINGDGLLDLATFGRSSLGGTATFRLGNGDGSFRAATSYDMSSTQCFGADMGDINGDGILDLVAASSTGLAGVRLGNGDGSFGATTNFQMDLTASNAIKLGDINGDGVLDLVSCGTGGGVGTSTVRLGTGAGTFGSAVSYTMDTVNANDVELADLNGDGRLDLITCGSSGSGTSHVRLGLGDGTFGSAVSYSMQGNALELGDMNGDGFLDLVTSGDGGASPSVVVGLGKGDGSFGSSTTYQIDLSTSISLTLGDVSGDGVLDVLSGGGGSVAVMSANAVAGISPLLSFWLTSRADALQALSQFDRALNRLSTQRGIIGAFQSRITVAGNVLQASAENYATASGRIKDADVAQESANLVRTQILQQAASSVLAQANQQPALAITLLGNS